MVRIRRKWAWCHDLWFDEPQPSTKTDLVLFYHWSSPVNPQAVMDVHSLEIDLHQPEDDIWKNFASTARNEIRRAIKENPTFTSWMNPDPEVLGEFFDFYKRFTRQRGLGEADPAWMRDYSLQGALQLTRVCSEDGQPLVWHSYYRNSRWVRLLQSASLFAESAEKELRNRIGRANRYLHWMDILECRRAGLDHYDFGGWYSGTEDEKLLRINAFKEQFGGFQTHRYHSMMAVSAAGRLLLQARKHLRGSKNLLHVV